MKDNLEAPFASSNFTRAEEEIDNTLQGYYVPSDEEIAEIAKVILESTLDLLGSEDFKRIIAEEKALTRDPKYQDPQEQARFLESMNFMAKVAYLISNSKAYSNIIGAIENPEDTKRAIKDLTQKVGLIIRSSPKTVGAVVGAGLEVILGDEEVGMISAVLEELLDKNTVKSAAAEAMDGLVGMFRRLTTAINQKANSMRSEFSDNEPPGRWGCAVNNERRSCINTQIQGEI